LGYREPQTGAEVACLRDRLPERVEHMREAFRRDAATRIRYREQHVLLSRSRANRELTAGFRELNRVANQVLEHFMEPLAICPEHIAVVRHISVNIEAGRRCERHLHVD